MDYGEDDRTGRSTAHDGVSDDQTDRSTESATRSLESPSNAVAVLESIVDPVLTVRDGSITYANRAARRTFDIVDDGDNERDESHSKSSTPTDAEIDGDTVFDHDDWNRLEEAIDETAIGTARHISLDDDRFDARIHRGTNCVTIVFDDELTYANRDTTRDRTDYSADHTDDGSKAAGSPSPPSLSTTRDRAVKARAIEEAPVGVAISDPDRSDNPLIYVNETFQEITGYGFEDVVGKNCRFLQGPETDPAAVKTIREAIAEERSVTVELRNYRQDGTEFWNEVTIAPVRNDRGECTHFVGFQNDVTPRKEAEREVERRNEELEYILERIEGLLEDGTAVIAGSTDRSTLEATICKRIVDEPAYSGAWIGDQNPATGTIERRTSAGDIPSPDACDGTDTHPAMETVDTRERSTGIVSGRTHVSFPLQYNEIDYGVLSIRASDDRAIDERETAILSALARAVASGINARETSRILETDAVVSVELELADRRIAPVAISEAADCRLVYRRSVRRPDADDTAAVYTVSGATAASIEDVVADRDDIDCEIVVDRDDGRGCLIELASDEDLISWLATRGAHTRSIDAEAGRARLVVDCPQSSNLRSLVDAVTERYPETTVYSFQHRERDDETAEEFGARLDSVLTDRQLAVLERAYHGGYFEWPRPTTGEELAASMDVTRPTFHEHLRSAEAKLVRAFFGEESNGNQSDMSKDRRGDGGE